MKKVFIFGAGLSGSVLARRYAEEGYKVYLFEVRNHIAGNVYDYENKIGIRIHKYGPHIFQTSDDKIISFVKKYADWKEFRHKVNARIGKKEIPLPVNFKAIDILFPKEAENIKNKLLKRFDSKIIHILDLLEEKDKDINKFGKYIYKNIFENYTVKMWGLNPENIEQKILKRVPIYLSYDDGYFLDKFQAVPKNGYTLFVKKLLDHKNINLFLNAQKNLLQIKDNKTFFDNEEIKNKIIWTGSPDQLFNYKLAVLPYRSLKFKFITYQKDEFQKRAVVNYPSHPTTTRITEYKKLSQQLNDVNLFGYTTIGKEFPGEYQRESTDFFEPYYPILRRDVKNPIDIYNEEIQKTSNLKLIGRLAEYKYKQMAEAINDALEMEL